MENWSRKSFKALEENRCVWILHDSFKIMWAVKKRNLKAYSNILKLLENYLFQMKV